MGIPASGASVGPDRRHVRRASGLRTPAAAASRSGDRASPGSADRGGSGNGQGAGRGRCLSRAHCGYHDPWHQRIPDPMGPPVSCSGTRLGGLRPRSGGGVRLPDGTPCLPQRTSSTSGLARRRIQPPSTPTASVRLHTMATPCSRMRVASSVLQVGMPDGDRRGRVVASMTDDHDSPTQGGRSRDVPRYTATR